MTETIKLTVAQAIVKFLNQQYYSVDGKEEPFVEGFFGIFGHGNVLGLAQALQEDPGHLKVYQGKNEQGMSHAASAFARQNLRQKIFAVTASAGPGSANIVTAAGTAAANNIPLLIFPADVFATRQPDPVLQQIEVDYSPTITTNDAFKPVSKFWDRIERPEQLMGSLIKGFEVLTNPATTGPVTICLPQDVEGMSYDYPVEFFNKRVHHLKRVSPDNQELQSASRLIAKSKNPILVVGGGAKYSEAQEVIKEFATKFNVPIVETHAGKSTIDSDFEYNLGGLGILGTSAANIAMKRSDLVIGLGTRYTDFTTSSKTIFNSEAQFININLNRVQTYKFDAVQMVADVKKSLEMLIDAVGDYRSKINNLADLKNDWNDERNRLANIKFDDKNFEPEIKGQFDQVLLNKYSAQLNTEYTQTRALIKLNDLIKDSTIVAAAGSLPGDVQRIWETNKFNTYHMEYGYSTMGYEVSGALGVRLADENEEVYALVGDGSFVMLHSELLTSLQYNKKINIILFDNSGFGSINNLQMGHGSRSYGTEFRDYKNDVINVDYAKIAEGYGAVSYKVNNEADLIAAISDAKKQSRSTLIEIKVLPKTMTEGYDNSWWRVGLSEVSDREQIDRLVSEQNEMLKNAKQY
ncbi:3D-(3,5/4)-trihydroxycyclohexane-1,2-dione acylhydrolase (decyclizing) [Companilactobacillus nodensis]|uniref:Protein IolD n=1 Tax=Companilactobacillus nodensis DSM 19682 = JCM 14932 = NBRC 107160 TaxID=1423775 RepID=A0A0R1KBF5_9LACO|nr:3D-(3,5/4)-trihydroxycyclohexane-1,2-dione acylhydrolase (decyclizing) [Companilactobacillus nodensis]KRK80816.1 protein IolD [Companilactobacillus nodensis DSM 19682 = JCM 14932 = NBRC 107160]